MLLTFARLSLDGMAAGMRKIAMAPGMLPGSTVRMRNFQISPSPSDVILKFSISKIVEYYKNMLIIFVLIYIIRNRESWEC